MITIALGKVVRAVFSGLFGLVVAAHSAPLLAQITEPTVLEDLGEALLDCADDAAWLARLDSAGQ